MAVDTSPLDVLFVQVASIREDMTPALGHIPLYASFPDHLPPARGYWLVYRYEGRGVPASESAPAIGGSIAELQETANRRGLKVEGIQLDIDSPTRSLPEYAAFLRDVRKAIPTAMQISITGLLDWFRTGTAIDKVLAEVDEFVPQFYDVSDRNASDGGIAIATRFDAAKWGPVFNRYHKRFRIGISTFGRTRVVRKQEGQLPVSLGIMGDVKPLDIAVDPSFALQTSRTDANELILHYRATKTARVGYLELEPGDEFQFILATPDSIGSAVNEARRMHGYCAGVVFFRWPSFNEALAAQPDEALRAAAAISPQQSKRSELRMVDGGCAAVNCVDLYLVTAKPLSPDTIRYHIHSSIELEYFLPGEKMPARMSGPSQIELSLPPYCSRARMYLGRAVTARRAEFTVDPDL